MEAVSEACGVFELEVIGGGGHVVLEFEEDGVAVAVEEADESADVLVVGVGGDFVGAGACALVDGVEEAGSEEAFFGVILADSEVAGAELEGFLEDVEGLFELVGAGEGAVEFSVFGWGLSGDVDAGVVICGGDDEVREGFVVELAGVELGLDVFDEAVFGEEGFDLGVGLDGIEIDDFEEEAGLFCFEASGGEEIGGDAIA